MINMNESKILGLFILNIEKQIKKLEMADTPLLILSLRYIL